MGNKTLLMFRHHGADRGGGHGAGLHAHGADPHAGADAVVLKAGIDPVYFGVLFIMNNAIGLITPPVGTVLNVVCGVAKDHHGRRLQGRAALPDASWSVLFLLVFFPSLVPSPEVVDGDLPRQPSIQPHEETTMHQTQNPDPALAALPLLAPPRNLRAGSPSAPSSSPTA